MIMRLFVLHRKPRFGVHKSLVIGHLDKPVFAVLLMPQKSVYTVIGINIIYHRKTS